MTADLGMGALIYALIEGGTEEFTGPPALVVAVAGLVAFFVAQAFAACPMMPLGLFRSHAVAVSVAGASRSRSRSMARYSCSACSSSRSGAFRH